MDTISNFHQDFVSFSHYSIHSRNHLYEPSCRNFAGIPNPSLKMVASSTYLPKENDRNPRGDDAHFIYADRNTIGVADGVGGWAKHGIDAGQYARDLMKNSAIAVYKERKGRVNPIRVLNEAYSRTRVQGSSTACVITLSDDILHAANVGDSGFIVLRNGVTVYKSPLQQRGHNSCPYQLGIGKDNVSSAEEVQVAVEKGDIVVVGTDGLFDNVHVEEIEEVVNKARLRCNNVDVDDTASMIANIALYNSFDRFSDTPYSRGAMAAGKTHQGGKIDDITVIVAYITH